MKKIGKITLHNLETANYHILDKKELRNIRGGEKYYVFDYGLCMFHCSCVTPGDWDVIDEFTKQSCNPGPWDRTKRCSSGLQNCHRMSAEELYHYHFIGQ